MPANLPPQYYELEREFKKENDPYEKLRLAKELLAIMPKHKGTDKLQADMKAKISELKKEVEGGGKKHGAHHVADHTHIEREGAAQVILIGSPNSGKSSIVDALTHAKPLIADYPFTTREPLAGMTTYDTVHFQLIDTPSISEDHFETYMPNLIRQADLVCVVEDVSAFGIEGRMKIVIGRLREKRIALIPASGRVGDDPSFSYKKTFLAANKYLDDGAGEGLEEIKGLYPDFRIVPTTILDDDLMMKFNAAIFESLGVIRVYTKRIGHEVEFVDPIILPAGGTVEDAARMLHKDFANNLQFAKVWGHGKFDGQKVKSSYVLSDKDIVEFHI